MSGGVHFAGRFFECVLSQGGQAHGTVAELHGIGDGDNLDAGD